MKTTIIFIFITIIITIFACKKKESSNVDKWGSPISKSVWVDRAVNSDNSLLVNSFGKTANDKNLLKIFYECLWDKYTEYLEKNIPENDIIDTINYRKDKIPDDVFGIIVNACGSNSFKIDNNIQSQKNEIDDMLSSLTPGLYPETSERRINASEIAGMPKNELRIMRNEIFARHGYIFKSEDLREYFGQQSWYNPRYDNVENYLSDIERYNIELIKNSDFEGSLAVIDDPEGYTNIRSGPGVNFNIIGIVREGEEFYARASSSNWWQIKTKTGVVGYMHKSRIHIIR